MKQKHTQTWPDPLRRDFSADCGSFQDDLRERLMQSLDQPSGDHESIREDLPMKKTAKFTARAMLVAVLAIVLVSASALAVATALNLGPFARYSHYEGPTTEQSLAALEAQRAEWEGKVFDGNGQPIDDLGAYLVNVGPGAIFDANGEKLQGNIEDGKLSLTPKTKLYGQVSMFSTLKEVQPYMAFDVVLPATIPEGYALDHFEMLGEMEPNKLNLWVVYDNPDAPDRELLLGLTLMTEETAFDVTTDAEMREIKVGGLDAVTDGTGLDILIGDVLYQFMPGRPGVALDALIRMAESIPQ